MNEVVKQLTTRHPNTSCQLTRHTNRSYVCNFFRSIYKITNQADKERKIKNPYA